MINDRGFSFRTDMTLTIFHGKQFKHMGYVMFLSHVTKWEFDAVSLKRI